MTIQIPIFPNAAEQFRLTLLQIFNWGTFHGLHAVPVSPRGHLLVGHSGAGKSTLLDAMTAMLTPPSIVDFNAAARESERSGRDRSPVSYVRGAWGEQTDEDTGEIATQTLRPATTWSAIAMTYQNESGQVVTLVQMFWIRGTTMAATELRRHYMVLEREFPLADLDGFADSNFDLRRIKNDIPQAFHRDNFNGYAERFRQLLGIESENALRLLHKTQSAKNVGDLNGFLRDYMLDRPETFGAASRLVDEFVELNQAHQSVVTARRQIETLAPARAATTEYVVLRGRQALLESVKVGVNAYCDELRIDLLDRRAEELRVLTEGLDGQVSTKTESRDAEKVALEGLEAALRDSGGAQIESWERELSNLEGQRTTRLQKRKLADEACRQLGFPSPGTPEELAETAARARGESESWNEESRKAREEHLLQAIEQQRLTKEFDGVRREIEALGRQPSNIPADMIDLRDSIADAIGIGAAAIPFVGELLQAKEDEDRWRGAAERVLRNFALSVLVDERNYPALAAHVNRTHLGRRLVYYRTGRPQVGAERPLAQSSLVFKLDTKQGPWSDWLRTELRRRFDYACVDDERSFRGADRAVTQEGQVKHSQTHHEKDDRRAVNDRRSWVLGFDNREKLALFKEQAAGIASQLEAANGAIRAIDNREKNRASRLKHCQTLSNMLWVEIDAAGTIDRIDRIHRQISDLRRDNKRLDELAAAVDEQKKRLRSAEGALEDIKVEQRTAQNELKTVRGRHGALIADPARMEPTGAQREALAPRFALAANPLTAANVDQAATRVVAELGEELRGMGTDIARLVRRIEEAFAEFLRNWPADGGGLDATIASGSDFMRKLEKLESDGLPAYEKRFYELLQTQSRQNLAALSQHLDGARREITERMELVNGSLSEVPFNRLVDRNSFLRIDVIDRQLSDVREFRQLIRQTLAEAFGDDPGLAEARFEGFRTLVDRLASQTPADVRWRTTVLDVRLQVEFVGREIGEDGVEIEVYRGGGGKSGGQRQKLATTCLAAALRYQLGGHDRGAPTYATVVLDEAFDKADNEFTALAMNVFANFGFQMVVATPLKSVMTLEPFIGGACFVGIEDRRWSTIRNITYDETRQKLDLPEGVRNASA